MNRDMTFERLLPRVGAVPPITADLPVAAGVAPVHRLLRRRLGPRAGRQAPPAPAGALYGHIGELLNELAVHRIVREALTKVVRHSGARRAAVSLVRHDDRLTVEIANHGAGGGERVNCPRGTAGSG
ncbi:hypothetical protein ACWGLO_06960 [Streptomyces niveus]